MTESQTATILITSRVGSTELRVSLGEDRADQLRRKDDDLLRAVVEAEGGTIIRGSTDFGGGPLNSVPLSMPRGLHDPRPGRRRLPRQQRGDVVVE